MTIVEQQPTRGSAERSCIICGNSFRASLSKIRNGGGLFCSRACQGASKRHRNECRFKDDGTAEIVLTQDQVAIVDIADLERVLSYGSWFAVRRPHTWYARCTDGGQTGMHSVVLPCGNGFMPDHIDGNGLNNKRSNLRPATKSDNARNCRDRNRGHSQFRGVTWSKPNKYWIAQIGIGGKRIKIGNFRTELEAARAYDDAASRAYGAFARLNFSEVLETL